MTLDRSNPGLKIAGPDNNFLFTAQLSACQCSGDHGADSTQSKHAIDKQAWLSVVARLIHGGELASKSTFHGFDPVTSPHRSRDNLRTREGAVVQTVTNLSSRTSEAAQIALGESHHGSFDSEVSQNLQMLFSLRHPTVVSSDNQKREIDRADAGNHVSYKIFVTRHIDDSDVEPLLIGRGEI